MSDRSQDKHVRRLDSWKEIAAYFDRDVRTVRRWEAQRGLPVHRFPGSARGGVFAFADELDRWLKESRRQLEESGSVPIAQAVTRVSSIVDDAEANDAAEAVTDPVLFEAEGSRIPPGQGRSWRWAALLVLLAAVGAFGLGAVMRERGPMRARAGVVEASSVDPRTRDLCLRARYLWDLRTEQSLTEAVQLYKEAAGLSPRYAPAYAGVAASYLLLRQYGKMADAEAYPRAYVASRKALELDESSVEAHRAYGFVLNFWMWNFPEAEKEFRRAMELDPRDAQSHQWYASSLFSMGRDGDALKEIDQARQLQPDSVAVLATRAFILRGVDAAAARESLEEIVRTRPEFSYAHRYLGQLYLDNGEYAAFVKEYRVFYEMERRRGESGVMDRAVTALRRGGPQVMFAELAEGFGRLAKEPGNADAMDAAGYYARLEDPQRTLEFLTLSCERRESNFQILPALSGYRFLKGNAAFEVLLTRSRTPLVWPELGANAALQVAKL